MLTESTRNLFEAESRLKELVRKRDILEDGNPARRVHDTVVKGAAQDDVAILTVAVSPMAGPLEGGLTKWAFSEDDADAAHRARSEFSEQLRTIGANEEDVYAAEMVFGELLGNVVRHARGPIEIVADWSGPAPVLHVRDQGKGFAYSPHLPMDLMAEGGRGLYLVAALAEDFNVTRSPAGGAHARGVISLWRRRLSRGHAVAITAI